MVVPYRCRKNTDKNLLATDEVSSLWWCFHRTWRQPDCPTIRHQNKAMLPALCRYGSCLPFRLHIHTDSSWKTITRQESTSNFKQKHYSERLPPFRSRRLSSTPLLLRTSREHQSLFLQRCTHAQRACENQIWKTPSFDMPRRLWSLPSNWLLTGR